MIWEDIHALALRDAYFYATRRFEQLSSDYELRRIFRAYSKTFHTPLHVVEALPIEEVLRAYYDDLYDFDDSASPKERDIMRDALAQEIEKLVRPPEELEAEQRREDEGDAISYVMGEENVKAEAAIKKLSDVVTAAQRAIAGVKKKGPEPNMVNVKAPVKIEDGIQMRFAAPGDIDDEADSFGIMADPKSRK